MTHTISIASFFMFVFLIGPTGQADPLNGCGEWSLEGSLVQHEHEWVLIVDRGSANQIDIAIDSKVKLKSAYNGVKVAALIKIPKRCETSCHGTLIRIREVLDPYERPRSPFMPRGQQPIHVVSCK